MQSKLQGPVASRGRGKEQYVAVRVTLDSSQGKHRFSIRNRPDLLKFGVSFNF